MLVHHVGAHVAFDGGVRIIDESVCQTGPGVIAHHAKIVRG
jgi:hypothetical protein